MKLTNCPKCGGAPGFLLERVLATAGLSDIGDDGEYDYCGESMVHWDTQEAIVSDAGRLRLTCGECRTEYEDRTPPDKAAPDQEECGTCSTGESRCPECSYVEPFKKAPVPVGCERCAGCPDCLTAASIEARKKSAALRQAFYAGARTFMVENEIARKFQECSLADAFMLWWEGLP